VRALVSAPCSLTKLSGQKPRLGQKTPTHARVGTIVTRKAKLHLGLRGVANVGRVGCWIWWAASNLKCNTLPFGKV